VLAPAAFLTFPAYMVGQERVDPMATTVGQWFAMIEQSFIALADAMPAASYGFKPTDGAFKDVRTFGEQAKHVACSNFAFFNSSRSCAGTTSSRTRRCALQRPS